MTEPARDSRAERAADSRRPPGASRGPWGHAVVIGAGFTGLLTARVLAGRFDRVTVLERDDLPSGAAHRSGLPQARHPHGMLARGARIVEDLFPGVRAELAAQGAPVFDFGAGFATRLPYGWAPRRPVGIEAQSFDLADLEAVLRARVRALRGVRVRDGFVVEGLRLSADRRRAVGVTGHRRADPGHTPVRIEADLIVDAAGRRSRLPGWLAAAGLPVPRRLKVPSPLVYSSRMYELTGDQAPDWLVAFEMTLPPSVDRGGAAVTVDGTRRLISLVAPAEELPPPRDDEALLRFAATLRSPHFAEVMARGRPVSPVYRSVVGGNNWLRYDRLRPRPDRLLVAGDAFCAFNPVYGQGLTVAALQARLLARLLATAGGPGGLAHRFRRRAARIALVPWLTATAADGGWSTEPASRPARMMRGLLDVVLRRLPDEPELYARFARVQNMVASPAVLLRPLLARPGRPGRRTERAARTAPDPRSGNGSDRCARHRRRRRTRRPAREQ
ncbi:NAD(P)/FAD-dependent oxidoreductase [Streptomyces scopuliridis]|uniref:NAD(P)/FAD-dependent oxidoreductase n=1 Tax=Streptomyces scopuliridis TaxID=452529 RepID=UPI0035E15BBD